MAILPGIAREGNSLEPAEDGTDRCHDDADAAEDEHARDGIVHHVHDVDDVVDPTDHREDPDGQDDDDADVGAACLFERCFHREDCPLSLVLGQRPCLCGELLGGRVVLWVGDQVSDDALEESNPRRHVA